jgi:DNA invertase Pin-like site-specific DNA recombinase
MDETSSCGWRWHTHCPKKIMPFAAHRKRYRFRHMAKPRKAPKQARRTNGRLRDSPPPSPLIGYMRVSKADGSQVLDLQRDALLAAGVSERHLYSDTASGKKDDRPGLAACLQALRKGDTLVVWKLDRLGRSLRHLVNVVHDLTNQGIGLRVLTGQGAALDTTTPAGKLVFGIFASLAEFERDLISERTRAGLASARARGRKGGRRPKMTPAKLRLAMAAMGKPETNVGDLCKELGVTRSTLYRHVSPTGEPRDDASKRSRLSR